MKNEAPMSEAELGVCAVEISGLEVGLITRSGTSVSMHRQRSLTTELPAGPGSDEILVVLTIDYRGFAVGQSV